MKEIIKIQQKIAPELIKVVERRYTILRAIFYLQPIGRRSLAEKLGISERKIRNDLEFLKQEGFINSTSAGARMTSRGNKLFYQLDDYVKALQGLDKLEIELSRKLGLKEVYIVPNTMNNTDTQQELGRFAAKLLQRKLRNEDVLAVTGGTTLAVVAELMLPTQNLFEVTVVPGRGGLGEEVEIQANTIAAKIAKKLGGDYHLLHVPDNLNESLLETIIKEPQIKEVLSLVEKADILIHGIGTAEVMAKRRGLKAEKIKEILTAGAVGEAFGYYFSQTGEIVHSTASVGIQLDDLKEIETTIAIAGGRTKAEAIISVVSNKYQDVLITDQCAAEEMLSLLRR